MNPFHLSELPTAVAVPAVRAQFALFPGEAFAPVIGQPRTRAGLDAAQALGWVAWIPRQRGQDGPLEAIEPIGVLCRPTGWFQDPQGRHRMELHPIARCRWSDLDATGPFDRVTVEPVAERVALDADLEAIACGVILDGLVPRLRFSTPAPTAFDILRIAMKGLGELADSIASVNVEVHGYGPVEAGLLRETDPRRRFLAAIEGRGVAPVDLPDSPELQDLRRALSELDDGDLPSALAAFSVFCERRVPLDRSDVVAAGRAMLHASSSGR